MSFPSSEAAFLTGEGSAESLHTMGLLGGSAEGESMDLRNSSGVLSSLLSQGGIPKTGDGSLLGGVSFSNGTDEGLGEDHVQLGSNYTEEPNRGLLAGVPQSDVQGGASDIGSFQDSVDDRLGGSGVFGGGSVFLGSSVVGNVQVALPSHYSATLAATSQA
uniref:Uncharacterized protein n=1 Tax=Chromera velia CCMP2878 TaxID=1169474 RepID=A0A0G4G966_9ALVE|eukprot:Cvel_20832.t1-p1 / transcript=Cvel_20832.t1 / gene=Cvel_20832 / organism=Chromera_velia_CCMP2878 / gene_product=hypothetical protein / transcript_product=hypothetical protein / location=Cvel_scaffold1906:5655-6134(+) / protein_length=160 / sequence_SO=supercontig / SO=protein_coding / is_pseudo=false